jgi:hypothetical protein
MGKDQWQPDPDRREWQRRGRMSAKGSGKIIHRDGSRRGFRAAAPGRQPSRLRRREEAAGAGRARDGGVLTAAQRLDEFLLVHG